MAKARQLTWIQFLNQEIKKELRTLKKQKSIFKIKLFFSFVLPIIIILLVIKITQTYITLKLKNIVTPQTAAKEPVTPVPVEKEVFPLHFVTPIPVGNQTKDV